MTQHKGERNSTITSFNVNMDIDVCVRLTAVNRVNILCVLPNIYHNADINVSPILKTNIFRSQNAMFITQNVCACNIMHYTSHKFVTWWTATIFTRCSTASFYCLFLILAAKKTLIIFEFQYFTTIQYQLLLIKINRCDLLFIKSIVCGRKDNKRSKKITYKIAFGKKRSVTMKGSHICH